MVFEETYTVDSEPEYDTRHEQSPVDEPGKHAMHATTDSGMEAEIETTRHVEDENECIGAHFEVVSESGLDAWTRSKPSSLLVDCRRIVFRAHISDILLNLFE